jgi:hypothetical protein
MTYLAFAKFVNSFFWSFRKLSTFLNPRKNHYDHVQVYVEGLRTNAVWAMLALIYAGQVLFLITYHSMHMTTSLISQQGDVFICINHHNIYEYANTWMH